MYVFNIFVYVIFQRIVHPLHVQSHENSLIKNDEKGETYYLPVGVYYEALCPDSRNFILQHLVPSFNKAPDSFDIEFVPYGKAKVTNFN